MTAVKGHPGLKPCGTEAAYQRHLRYHRTPCDLCYQAHAAYRAAIVTQHKRLCALIGVLARLLLNPPPPDRKTP